MTYIILDTNVLVSALWQHLDYGNPARLVRLCIERRFGLVYSAAMYREYEAVLARPKFAFDRAEVDAILGIVRTFGCCADPVVRGYAFPLCRDPDDQKFYDAAQCWDAILVTGNTKHFPDDQRACTPADFLANRQL